MNIYQRLNEVRKVVSYLQKDKKVDGKGYMAITHDAVTAAVREPFITHGIMVVPTVVKSAMVDSGTVTGKGNPFMRYEATYRVSFVNCDEPADRVDVDVEAHALDEGDKAPGKAISYATKYAFLKLLSIETGLDDEAREQAKPKPKEAAKTEEEKPLITGKRKVELGDVAASIRQYIAKEDEFGAFGMYETEIKSEEEKLYVWELLPSNARSAIKRLGAEKSRMALEAA